MIKWIYRSEVKGQGSKRAGVRLGDDSKLATLT